jgi:hypothetical protein
MTHPWREMIAVDRPTPPSSMYSVDISHLFQTVFQLLTIAFGIKGVKFRLLAATWRTTDQNYNLTVDSPSWLYYWHSSDMSPFLHL